MLRTAFRRAACVLGGGAAVARAARPPPSPRAALLGSLTFASARTASSRAKHGEIAYDELAGLPESFAREAGEYALAGVPKVRSRDGYDIATIAGGCFWGIELLYFRGADIPWRRVAAAPRRRCGYSVETGRGGAAAATAPRPRRGYIVETR